MSLATRITLLVCILLAASGLGAGAAFQRAHRRTAEAELAGRLGGRLAWLEGALDVELDDGEIQLEDREEPAGVAEHWQVGTPDGKTLWSSPTRAPADALTQSRRLSFGPATAPVLAGDALVSQSDGAAAGQRTRPSWASLPVTEVPAAAIQAARNAVPELEVRQALRKTRVKKKDVGAPAVFDLRGVVGGKEHEVRVDTAGRVERVRRHDVSGFPEYELPADAAEEVRLDLVISAQASAAAINAELARTARLLWTLGPLALLLTAVGLVVLIRWQLAPLKRVAREAGAIGPESASGRIGPAGSSAELTQLRQAINAMLERLGEALEREKRFAATAAHELRTPLGQMRMNVDVTLRRERNAQEYREAMTDLSADVQRLERLVLGLLQLTRGTSAAAHVTPLHLAQLLRRAAEGRGTVTLDDRAGNGVWVYGDADLLASAIGNVIENAQKYAPGEPPSVRVERAGDRIRLSIADRGPGIAETDRERIFEPLTRLETARTVGASPDGLGLGLAVARAAARAAGGELVCRGRSDGASGSEFIFMLRAATPTD